MTMPRPHETVIRTHADLFALWRDLMGPGSFGRASIWLAFLDEDNRMLPVLVPLDDIPPEPDRPTLRSVCRIVADLVDTGDPASVALLLSRPGPTAMIDADRRWARALREELGDELALWPIHLATFDRIQVFAPDDLVLAS